MLDFGTSGRLYRSNLLMYDRQHRNLWSQFAGEAVIGDRFLGTRLTRVPAWQFGFGELTELHPGAQVMSRDTGFVHNYGHNPYQLYDQEEGRLFLFEDELDDRHPPMKRFVGLREGGTATAVALDLLERRRIAGVPIVVTYCPLCRSGAVYDRRLVGRELTFGNTSALYDSNLVMFDHETNSYWWQVAGRAIVGDLTGAELDVVPSTMMTWSEWADQHPSTQVLSPDTSFDRSYTGDGLAGYREAVNAGNRPFSTPGAVVEDDRLDPAEEVLGIVFEGEVRVFPLRLLGDQVVNHDVAGRELVIITSREGPSGRVFDRQVADRVLTFDRRNGGLVDRETGSMWTRSRRAVKGPMAGTTLDEMPSRTSLWFVFISAFPSAQVVAP